MGQNPFTQQLCSAHKKSQNISPEFDIFKEIEHVLILSQKEHK